MAEKTAEGHVMYVTPVEGNVIYVTNVEGHVMSASRSGGAGLTCSLLNEGVVVEEATAGAD